MQSQCSIALSLLLVYLIMFCKKTRKLQPDEVYKYYMANQLVPLIH